MISLLRFYYRLAICALSIIVTTTAYAQTTPQYYNNNASTSSNAIPLGGGGYATNKCQFLYGANSLNSSGTTGSPAYNGLITTVYFRVNNYNSAVVYTDFTVSLMQNVGTATTFPSTTFGTTSPSFYQSTYSLPTPAVGDWVGITLQTPFLYDPNLSIILELKASNSSGGTSSSNGMRTGTGSRLYGTYSAVTGSTSTSTLVDFGFDLVPNAACTAPPTPGSAVASNTAPCFGQTISLNLTGNSIGSGQTYQWESATSLSGPWTPEGTLLTTTPYLSGVAPQVGTTYYRCQVTCGASTITSVEDTVVVPTLFPGGTYTINSAVATGGSNFQNFTDAMSAIGCGISSSVILNVTPGSGPYNEQIIIPNTINTNATTTLTINGNGETVQHSATVSNTGVLMIDGADYVKVDSLTLKTLNTSFGSGAILYNACDYDTLTRLIIDASSVTATASTNFGIRIATSPSSTSTTASGASNTYVANCEIIGSTMGNNGIYYGLYAYGPNTNNVYYNNTITNAYLYSMYVYYGDGNIISNNHITRETKTGTGYCYGLAASSLTGASQVLKNRIEYLGGATDNGSYCYPLQITSNVGTSTTPILVANNLVCNMTSIPLNGGINVSGSYVDVYHNTVSIDLPLTYSTTSTQSGIYNGSTTANIMNNLVSYKGGGPNTKYGIYLSSAPASCDYNNIYMNSSATGTQNYGYRASAYATLAAFQSGTSFEINGHDYDPSLIYLNGVMLPQSGIMDNLATPLASVTDDILGNARSLLPDFGALEYTAPTCPPSGQLGAQNESVSTVDIIWTPTSTAAQWEIQYGPMPFTLGTGTTVSATIYPHTLTSLQAATTYGFYIRDICSPGDTSLWAFGGTFTTLCDTFQAPYTESFDGSAGTPLCWSVTNAANGGKWAFATGPFNNSYGVTSAADHTGNGGRYAWVDGSSPIVTGQVTILTSPLIDFSTLTTPQLRYYIISYVNAAYLSDINKLAVEAYDFNASTWVLIDSVQQSFSSEAWQERIASLASVTSTTTQLRFRFEGTAATTFYNDIFIDDINIEEAPTCPAPNTLTATNPTTSSIDLSWISTSIATQFQIEYAQGTGFTLGTGTRVGPTGVTNPYTVTGLTASTPYTFYVRDICAVGDSSNWTGPITQFTAFPVPVPNDDCFTPVNIGNGALYYGSNAGGTQTEAPCDAPNTTSATDVWYTFTTGSAGIISDSIKTDFSGGDVVVQMYTGACGTLTPVIPTAGTTFNTTTGCVDGPAAGTEWSTYNVTASTTYFIRVYSFGTSTPGPFSIQIVGSPLAITLDKISATNIGKSNRVDWNTLSEEASDKFELQRSADGKDFATIAKQNAKGTASRYTYVDNAPFTGINYYRLMMRDASGKTEYSKVVNATVQGKGFSVQAYPNPVSDELTIKVNGNQSGNAEILLTDMTGKVIKRMSMNSVIQTVNMNGLASGIYLIKYVDDEQSQTLRITKE